jgi:phosphohistidine phosphatase
VGAGERARRSTRNGQGSSRLRHDEGVPQPVPKSARYLWILRHGKAASDAPWGGTDRERPLTARGRRDASALGTRLADEEPLPGLENVPKPQLVVCSAAVRTRQTADLIVDALGNQLPLDSYRSLYEADTDVALQYLREIDEGVKSALLVGHNPTMFQLAWELLGDGSGGDLGEGAVAGGGLAGDIPPPMVDSAGGRATLEAHGFPTCALAVLALGVAAWEDVVHGCGSLLGVFRPPY